MSHQVFTERSRENCVLGHRASAAPWADPLRPATWPVPLLQLGRDPKKLCFEPGSSAEINRLGKDWLGDLDSAKYLENQWWLGKSEGVTIDFPMNMELSCKLNQSIEQRQYMDYTWANREAPRSCLTTGDRMWQLTSWNFKNDTELVYALV